MSFLSRIARLPAEREVDRVRRNLGYLFNTKKGYGSVVADYGLGDYETGNSTDRSVLLLIDEMTAAVRQYEPALRDPEVTLLGRTDPAGVRLALTGTLDGVPRRFLLDMNTTDRSVAVQETRTLVVSATSAYPNGDDDDGGEG
jgi:predicted component of type VI protein secretion system